MPKPEKRWIVEDYAGEDIQYARASEEMRAFGRCSDDEFDYSDILQDPSSHAYIPGSIEVSKALCAQCPVADECLMVGLHWIRLDPQEYFHMIFGGLTVEERRALRGRIKQNLRKLELALTGIDIR